MVNVTAPIEKTDELILRWHLASATMGDERYDVSMSVPPGALVLKTPRGTYLVKIEDMLSDLIKMEQGGMFDAP